MTTAVKTKSTYTIRKQSKSSTSQEPKRLSKAGQWLHDNPGGWITVIDRRAVNK